MGNSRRARGGGTVYQRKLDNLWVGRYDLPTPRGSARKRRVVYGRTEGEARERLSAAMREVPPRVTVPLPRTLALRAARERGSHSRHEWFAALGRAERVRGRPHYLRCFYCWAPVHVSRIEKDHFIPVTRGGSDALSNLVPACRPCNRGKHNATGFEWFEVLTLSAGGWLE